MISNEKLELIAILDNARAHLDALLVHLDAKMDIYPPWHLKELIDHIAGWDDAVLASLRAHARDDVPVVTAPRGIDYYNAETVTTRESLPLERSRQEYETTRQLLKKAILEMPADKFQQPLIFPWGPKGTMNDLVKIFVHHEYEHAREIETLLIDKGIISK